MTKTEISQGELLNAPRPVRKARPKPGSPGWKEEIAAAQARGESVTGYPDLAGLLAEQRAKAESVVFSQVDLAAWHRDQVAALDARRHKLFAAFENNLELVRSMEDPRWPALWTQRARHEYLEESYRLASERGHVMVCPNHGVDGVEIPEEQWEPLSLQGILADEGAMQWTRYCEKCALTGPIQQRAQQLMESA